MLAQKHFEITNPDFQVQDDLAWLEVSQELFDPQAVLDKLGGTIKLMKIEQEVHSAEIKNALKAYIKGINPVTKFNLGISSYLNQNLPLLRIEIDLKKELKAEGFKLRFIESKEPQLSSVQVSKNQLTDLEKGVEFNLLSKNGKVYLATTCAVQDFESYSERDYGKPGRSAKLGMLPPKLAQIMLNLASVKPGDLVLDPFCGTGTIAMEGLLMGVNAIASDFDAGQMQRTEQNLEWLNNKFDQEKDLEITIFEADARNIVKELESREICAKVTAIVSEGYLGPAQARVPSLQEMKQIFSELAGLYRVVFENYANLLPRGARVVMTLPYFRARQEQFMPLDKILTFSRGFTLQNPLSASNKQERPSLKYAREDQVVGREVFVWEKL
ncbi:MAG: DNA methyltransferase [Candidatus Gracilibacteria bacterium]|nr:DNA methyltransferase [Candidatus Gracilibacteria bacterium]